VCGATGGLAAAGVLDERPHTSNAREYLAYFPNYAGQEHYVDELAVIDGDLITASGTAPVDFARAIFERLGVYVPEVLGAWVAMYKHQDQSAFYTLMAASAKGTGAA
jgi:transcriptional regulator GlxA family with amidase domain